MTFGELRLLLEPEVLTLLDMYRSDDPSGFAMRFQGRKDIPVRAIAEQIACSRKALKKLPAFSLKPMLYTSLALEQASGETTARYKASLAGGERLIDLSGGLGIDVLFFSKVFDEVVYCERDPVLEAIATYNFRLLGIKNVRIIEGDSLAALHLFPEGHFDWIYADPARREGGRRSIGLHAASPDVVAAHDLLLSRARKVMLKASPAIELSVLHRQLPSLSQIHVVSVGGECREVLLLLDRELPSGTPESRKAVQLSPDGRAVRDVIGTGYEPREVAMLVGEYFYEPDAAIIKAGLAERLAADLGLGFVNGSVDYLTSGRFIADFPGRTFLVAAVERYSPKTFPKFLTCAGISGAAVQRRDFPLSPEDIRRKFRLRESDSNFLFFTRDPEGELICVYGIKPAGAGAAPSLPDRNAVPGC